jgi:phosphatidylinositol alpha-1,6-mannosyltransferase
MKILYLTPGCFDKGGISRYNRYQIQALRELYGDANVRVLSLLGPRPGDFEEPFTVNWHGKGIDGVSKVKYALNILKNCVGWNPDLVITAHVNFSGLAKMLASIRGNKTFLNTYGLEVWSGLKKLPYWGIRNTDFVISDCHYTARYLETENLRPKDSVKVIWDCVDLNRFVPAAASVEVAQRYNIPDPGKYKLIVSLGRISRAAAHKGYDRLIKAFSLIHARFPMARLVFAGKGDWIDELKQMAESAGIADKVTFTGMVEEQHLPAIYRMAYVFSLASDRGKGRGEGIPLTPLEAMACRVPIIVGNHDGSQEAVFNQQNGFVIDSLDIELHAGHLAQLLENEKLRNDMADNAVKIARQYFSYEEFKLKHRSLIENFLSGKNNRIEAL